MKVTKTNLSGVLIIEPAVHGDDRGFFFEIFQQQRYQDFGITLPFVQDNFSRSKKDTVRGLHYQYERPQGKLVFVAYGKVLDVIVDIRKDSPTFGRSIKVELDHHHQKQIYIPRGFAHGFCVLSDYVDFIYKCDDFYLPELQRGIAWNDPDLNIEWPVTDPILSLKDQQNPLLKMISEDELLVS